MGQRDPGEQLASQTRAVKKVAAMALTRDRCPGPAQDLGALGGKKQFCQLDSCLLLPKLNSALKILPRLSKKLAQTQTPRFCEVGGGLTS